MGEQGRAHACEHARGGHRLARSRLASLRVYQRRMGASTLGQSLSCAHTLEQTSRRGAAFVPMGSCTRPSARDFGREGALLRVEARCSAI
eukprot:5242894-Pleurochrysis_carterae.AAC.8